MCSGGEQTVVMGGESVLASTAAALRSAGCVAADEEALELLAAAGDDTERLRVLLARRTHGEPLAWITGSVRFCGEKVLVREGVYVPRWQSEPLALEAADRLPEDGLAVDLCTGAGAIAVVLARRRPRARIVGTDLDPVAVTCATANGVEAYEGDLSAPLPAGFLGRVDVVTGVVPYVPTGQLRLLARDVLDFEPRLALDGGEDGMQLLVRAADEAARLLRVGGSLLLELGGDEAELLSPRLVDRGYREIAVRADEDGDVRAIVCLR